MDNEVFILYVNY